MTDLGAFSFRDFRVNGWWRLTNCITTSAVVNWTQEEVRIGSPESLLGCRRAHPVLPHGDGSGCALTKRSHQRPEQYFKPAGHGIIWRYGESGGPGPNHNSPRHRIASEWQWRHQGEEGNSDSDTGRVVPGTPESATHLLANADPGPDRNAWPQCQPDADARPRTNTRCGPDGELRLQSGKPDDRTGHLV
jgi:hypothetical protein